MLFSSPLRAALSVSLACVATLAISATRSEAQSKLNVGDPAPSVQSTRWLKGKPVPAFEKGQLYVVEFWATWCGPCKENIPHLTELAKQYKGKVEIIGMDIWESQDPKDDKLPKVAAFVKSMGAKMDYHVGADTADGRIAKAWMEAAGEQGIPAAFLIGKDGRIAWIGHPAEMESVLKQAVAGTLDTAAIKAKRTAKRGPDMAIQEAMSAKDYAKAIKLIDVEIAKDPANGEPRWAYQRFTALSHVDIPEFKKRARKLLAEQNNGSNIYNLLCAVFASEAGLAPEAYQFGLELTEEALPKKERAFIFYAMAAQMHLHLGDKAKAIETQEAAIKAAEEDPRVTAEGREMQRKALERIKAAK